MWQWQCTLINAGCSIDSRRVAGGSAATHVKFQHKSRMVLLSILLILLGDWIVTSLLDQYTTHPEKRCNGMGLELVHLTFCCLQDKVPWVTAATGESTGLTPPGLNCQRQQPMKHPHEAPHGGSKPDPASYMYIYMCV